MSKKRLKKKQKKRLLQMFFRMMGLSLVVCTVVGVSLVGCYNAFFQENEEGTNNFFNGFGNKSDNENTKDEEKEGAINTNLAVFGVDEDGYRTDVIFVVNFNSTTGKIKVASLPRDTKVIWTEEQKDVLRDMGKYTVNVSKLNEMTSYGGMDHIEDLTINQIENMLSIRVDNYVIVDLDAFKQIVDAVGGVDMYVPQRLYYNDYAGGLHIDLQEGQQNLDGEKAEQLVRFRKYPQGDVARVEVQQAFLKAFADKVVSPSIITKIPKLIEILFDTVTTDIKFLDAVKYSGYLNKINTENLSFHTIPGVGAYEGGISYYFPDMNEIGDFINEVFYDTTPVSEEVISDEDEEVIVEDKTVSIQILNGSGVGGAAARVKDALEQKGYSVSQIGNYTSNDVVETVIYAKDLEKAEQFKAFYPNADIKQNTTLEYDIQIILGQPE